MILYIISNFFLSLSLFWILLVRLSNETKSCRFLCTFRSDLQMKPENKQTNRSDLSLVWNKRNSIYIIHKKQSEKIRWTILHGIDPPKLLAQKTPVENRKPFTRIIHMNHNKCDRFLDPKTSIYIIIFQLNVFSHFKFFCWFVVVVEIYSVFFFSLKASDMYGTDGNLISNSQKRMKKALRDTWEIWIWFWSCFCIDVIMRWTRKSTKQRKTTIGPTNCGVCAIQLS